MTLRLETNGSVQRIYHFVQEVRRTPDFHMVQMMGNRKGSVEIRLRLRKPMRLKEALLQMKGVSQVDFPGSLAQGDDEPLLDVQIAEVRPSSQDR